MFQKRTTSETGFLGGWMLSQSHETKGSDLEVGAATSLAFETSAP